MVILAVDDDKDDLDLFCEILKRIDQNIKCFYADSCDEAIKILKDNKPDVIFLDINMPRMNGKECLLHVKTQDHLKQIPVVIYSTAPDTSDFIHYDNPKVIVLQKNANFIKSIESIKVLLLDIEAG